MSNAFTTLTSVNKSSYDDGYYGQIDPAVLRELVTALDNGQVSLNKGGKIAWKGWKNTPEGGGVTVRLLRRGSASALEVVDTGPGIDREDLPHVFERLYVAQRYRPVRPAGSGLGLAIVKELADAMGGEVAVASTPGVGTTVTVVFAS